MQLYRNQNKSDSSHHVDKVVEKCEPPSVAFHSDEKFGEVIFYLDLVSLLALSECQCWVVQVLLKPSRVHSILRLLYVEALSGIKALHRSQRIEVVFAGILVNRFTEILRLTCRFQHSSSSILTLCIGRDVLFL